MTREQAIEKIKKLQALKEGAAKVNSEGEAKNAATIIDKLQKQFGITMEEVYAQATVTQEPVDEPEPQSQEEKSNFSFEGNNGYEQWKASHYSQEDEEPEEHYYTQEEVDEACEKIQTNLRQHFFEILKRYGDCVDPDQRYQLTLNDIDKYYEQILNNDDLCDKCNRMNIDLLAWLNSEYGKIKTDLVNLTNNLKYAQENTHSRKRRKKGVKTVCGMSVVLLFLYGAHGLFKAINSVEPSTKEEQLYQKVKDGRTSEDQLSDFDAGAVIDKKISTGEMNYEDMTPEQKRKHDVYMKETGRQTRIDGMTAKWDSFFHTKGVPKDAAKKYKGNTVVSKLSKEDGR